MPAALERELDRLYRLPLGEFTAARNDLAKQLRDEGQTDQAEQVKALKKPSVAVWLANQLAHEDEVDIKRLLKAGEALTNSQAQLAGGRSSDDFLEARREEQRALERLAREAHELVAQQGIGASAVERAIQTLRAASLTKEGREQLKRGRLTEELRPPGFEALAGVGAAASRSPQTQRGSKSERQAEQRRALKEAREALRRARTKQRELDAVARTVAREAERAEDEALRRRREAGEAQAEADAAAREVSEAEGDVEQLRA
jgi:hypothetical protein